MLVQTTLVSLSDEWGCFPRNPAKNTGPAIKLDRRHMIVLSIL
jgi:hypothetical protein